MRDLQGPQGSPALAEYDRPREPVGKRVGDTSGNTLVSYPPEITTGQGSTHSTGFHITGESLRNIAVPRGSHHTTDKTCGGALKAGSQLHSTTASRRSPARKRTSRLGLPQWTNTKLCIQWYARTFWYNTGTVFFRANSEN